MSDTIEDTIELNWHALDSEPFRLSGLAWYDQDRALRRLPKSASGNIRPGVDDLANQPTGVQVAFRTDSRKLHVRASIAASERYDHMPATAQCGFDLYLGDPEKMHFHTVTRFNPADSKYESPLLDLPDRELRSVTLNLPIFAQVESASVGLDADASIQAPLPWSQDGRIVIYGTSITHGGCASRPGMSYTNILSRMLNMEIINLGFSGNGIGEPEVIELVAEIPDSRLIVLDYEANAGHEGLINTLPGALDIIRARHPEVPLLVLSRIRFSWEFGSEEADAPRKEARDYQAAVVAEHRQAGDANIHFMDGAELLTSTPDECTVDGVHPTDLGFSQMANALFPVIRDLI